MYKHHLNCAAYWHNSWLLIQNYIDEKLQMETEALYGKHNKNIENLFEKQKRKMKNQLTNQNQNVYQTP